MVQYVRVATGGVLPDHCRSSEQEFSYNYWDGKGMWYTSYCTVFIYITPFFLNSHDWLIPSVNIHSCMNTPILCAVFI